MSDPTSVDRWRFRANSSSISIESSCGFYRARQRAAVILGASPDGMEWERIATPADVEIREVGSCDFARGKHKYIEQRRRIDGLKFTPWEAV